MKKKIFLASLAMLAIVAIIVVSCNENEELDDFYSLDVTSRTPITKSSMADYEPGASQTIGGSTTSPYTVPENEDECMLYAIISIAASRHIPITYRESDGSGGYKKSTKTIGRNGFTATQAYNYVKSMATGQDWTPCDVDGILSKAQKHTTIQEVQWLHLWQGALGKSLESCREPKCTLTAITG